MIQGNITIKKQLLWELKVDSEELRRLNAGGVDNWEWHSESMSAEGALSLDEFKEKEKNRIAALSEKQKTAFVPYVGGQTPF